MKDLIISKLESYVECYESELAATERKMREAILDFHVAEANLSGLNAKIKELKKEGE
jgi:hypothetical protein